jgi:hypothetical protein
MDFKNSTLYLPESHPFFEMSESGIVKGMESTVVLFFMDEKGNDWYVSQKNFADETLKILYTSDKVIRSVNTDVSAITPYEGCSVSEVNMENLPDIDIEKLSMGGWMYDGDEIITRVYTDEELIKDADDKKRHLLDDATRMISPLQDAKSLGLASDDELATLEAWMLYRILVSRINVGAAPDIEWPKQPA